ncbi:MAG: TVP38/TMEM64 family protein [Rhodovibrionaceae bacterium]
MSETMRRPESDGQEAAPGRQKSPLAKALPLLALLAGGALLWFVFDVGEYLTYESLQQHRDWLQQAVAANAVLAAFGFIALYIVTTAFSIPVGVVLTVLGGFLFGALPGTLYAVIGATAGAVAVFLAARSALRETLRRRAGPAVRRMEAGFQEDALSYMFVLRLIPLFPFWLVNLAPAFLGVPLRTYFIGTFFGIVPGTLVFAWVGSGLDEIFARGETPDAGIIFAPEILGPILGLVALALLPVVYKKWKARRGA